MKKTFVCDESMIITIPIGSLNGAREGQLMPDKFQCVYKDSYKIFAINGKPKPLGAAQAIAGVFIVTLGLIFNQTPYDLLLHYIYTLPSVVFVVSGMLSYAAGQSPNMHVTKLSFSLNIISFFWSIVAVCFCGISLAHIRQSQFHEGIEGLILTLLVFEKLMAVFLIYWLSKAICRQSFNTLPTILLKQTD
ncbi:uncharacterized protein [Pagrus major]|uniref:uncharacterized protein n=1 Tax=Pagrus major TaxID=143350 RepID=UPI003CC8CBF5